MTVHLCTFSDESMSRARDLCVESAKANGVSCVWEWDEGGLLESAFYLQNKIILDQPKGFGLWLWKPWICLDTFAQGLVADGDILIYADAGIEFIDNVNYIIDRMDQDIFLFGNNWEHAHWCKRDAVQAIWPSKFWKPNLEYHSDQAVTWERFGKQVQASVIFFRVSDYSRKFVAEWLKFCLMKVESDFLGDRHLIDDSPSILPNHPEFREHRHDQAILTTLGDREGIKKHWWPAVYNKGGSPEFVYEKLPEYAGDDYPVLFSHNRKRNHEW